MSDCSTETMEPKEPPISSMGIGVEDLQKCVELIAAVTGAPAPDCPCNLTDVYHSVKDLQQRYQQLEQVAKDMMALIDASRAVGLPFSLGQCEMLSKQLEALGVSLDD